MRAFAKEQNAKRKAEKQSARAFAPTILQILSPLTAEGYRASVNAESDKDGNERYCISVFAPVRLLPAPRTGSIWKHHQRSRRADLKVLVRQEVPLKFAIKPPWRNLDLRSNSLISGYCNEKFGIGSERELTEEQFLRVLTYWHELNVEYAEKDKPKKRFGLF